MAAFEIVGLSVFVAVYLWFIWSWDLPVGSIAHQLTKKWAGKGIEFCGLYHSWRLFAPNPAAGHSYLYFELVFRNGHTRRVDLPLFDSSRKDFDTRMARYLHGIHNANEKVLRHSLSRFVVNQVSVGEKVEIVQVRFILERRYPEKWDQFRGRILRNTILEYIFVDILDTPVWI